MTGRAKLPNLLYLGVACLLIATGGATPSFATVRAVLVGVSDYTYLEADLIGPRNDLRLMSEALVVRGVEPRNMQVLGEKSDGLLPDLTVTEPTKSNIIKAFQNAIDQSEAGDTVVFYFSGHGSQAPDADGDEQGGYDEIFLPKDAKSWNGSIGQVENAILDDEFNTLARQSMAKDLKLIVFIDACHSATGFRALGGRGVARYLDPSILGLPEAEDTSDTLTGSPPLNGEFVFLYSSQSNQRSFEYPLADPSDTSQWYGDFSRNLAHILKTEPELSYEGLLQSTTRAIRRNGNQFAQTPDGEGSLMAEPVFGSDTGLSRRISVKGKVLNAGLLSNITSGSRVALFETAVSDTPVGYALIDAAKANTATLIPESQDVVLQASFAEVVDAAPPPSLSISVSNEVADRLAKIGISDPIENLPVEGVELSGTGADGTLVVAGESIALVGPDGVLDGQGEGSSLRLADFNSETVMVDLANGLDRFARSRRLLAAIEGAAAKKSLGMSLLSSGVKVSVERKPGLEKGGKCRLDKAKLPEPIKGPSTKANHCDQIWITLTNSTTKMQDVTVLYMDRDNRITALYGVIARFVR